MAAVLLLALEILLRADARDARRAQAQTRIEIAIEPSTDRMLDGPLQVWASEGDLGPVEARSDGSFLALYTPTRDTFPRVVLLRASASSRGVRRSGWLALPISGADDLALRTKPETRVRVALGGRVFGPVRSDARGNARVHVVVPPGIRSATVSVRDAFGNSTAREVDLAPPPFRCVAALADREAGETDGEEPRSIEVFAVTPSGAPASIADLKLSAARGTVAVAPGRRPGVFRVSYRAPEQGGGAETVTVRAFGSSDAVRFQLASRSPPAGQTPAAAVSIAAKQSALPAASTAPALEPARPGTRPGVWPFALAAGALLRGQSNLSRGNGGGAVFELAGTLPRTPFADIRRLEAMARLEGFAFASQIQPGPSPGDPLRSGAVRAYSLSAGLRATLLSVGRAQLHAAALAGALRSFDTVRVVGGPADGVEQSGARWSALAAAAGGASMHLGRGRVLAELQLAFSPAHGQLQGNLGGLSLSAGYLFDLN